MRTQRWVAERSVLKPVKNAGWFWKGTEAEPALYCCDGKQAEEKQVSQSLVMVDNQIETRCG